MLFHTGRPTEGSRDAGVWDTRTKYHGPAIVDLDNLIQPLGEPVIFIESNNLLIALDYVQSVNVIFKWRSKPQCG